MTCIVGFVAPDKKVYMGGDSAGIAGWNVRVRADEKVFRVGEFLMGFTTSFRMGQLLRYHFSPQTHPVGMSDHEYMVTKTVPEIRKVFKEHGYIKVENSQEEGGQFLIGYRGALYEIASDFQVGVPATPVACIGAGGTVALGALYGLFEQQPLPAPPDLIRKALQIATELNASVRPPFVVLELP
jgi:ATP-dependent protease HslVU (ClpYQ) peptidase subunit